MKTHPQLAAASIEDGGAVAAERCASCGAPLAGPFCHRCGERRLGPDDLTVRHFVAEGWEAFTDLDNKLARTLRRLVARPGFLTNEYLAGRRTPYVRPLQLFLLMNLLYFLALSYSGGARTFDTPLRVHMYRLPHSGLAQKMVRAETERTGVSLPEYEIRFDGVGEQLSRTLIILNIPLYTLLLWLMYRRSRSYLAHLVAATHLYTVLLLLAITVNAIGEILGRLAAGSAWSGSDGFYTGLTLPPLLVYLYVASRRVYGKRVWETGLKTLVLGVAIIPVLQVYRLLLFFLTFYSVGS